MAMAERTKQTSLIFPQSKVSSYFNVSCHLATVSLAEISCEIYPMASYNNYYGNIVYSILGGRVIELIMDTAMSDKCWSKGKYGTVLCYDTKDNAIKWGKICWAKHSHFSWFSRVLQKKFHEFLFILCKLHMMVLFKRFKHEAPQKFSLHWVEFAKV